MLGQKKMCDLKRSCQVIFRNSSTTSNIAKTHIKLLDLPLESNPTMNKTRKPSTDEKVISGHFSKFEVLAQMDIK